MRHRLLMAAAISAGFSGAAMADARLSYGPPGGAPGQLMELNANAVRISQSGQAQWMLYRDAEKAVYIVDDGQRSYQKVDEKMVANLRRQIDGMKAQVEAQLAMLPPEQRAMMQGMMPKIPDFSAEKYTVSWGETNRQVAGYDCRPLTVLNDGQPVEEMCLASLESLKMTSADLKLLKSMGKTLGQLAASFGAGSMAAVMEQADGVPVEHKSAGASQPRAVLQSVTHETLPEARFALPKDYAQRSLIPGMPQ